MAEYLLDNDVCYTPTWRKRDSNAVEKTHLNLTRVEKSIPCKTTNLSEGSGYILPCIEIA